MTFSKEELQRELLKTFEAELDQHAETLEKGLLELEGTGEVPSPELVAELFRAAHSLKGAARMVELDEISRLAHSMEDVLAALRDGAVGVSPEVIDTLLAGTDGLRRAMAAFESGTVLGEGELGVLQRALKDVLGGRGAVARVGGPVKERAVEAGTSRAEPPSPSPVEELPARSSDRRSPADRPDGQVIRVAAAKIDALIARVGELLVAQQAHAMRSRELGLLAEELTGAIRRSAGQGNGGRGNNDVMEAFREGAASLWAIQRSSSVAARASVLQVKELQEAVYGLRLVPLRLVLDRLPRIVRDAARQSGKEVRLELEGEDVEIDRSVLDLLHDPLLHLVRNAVDHGIEAAEIRQEAGKPRVGELRVTARRRGGVIEIEVGDDGAGIPVDRLVDRAVAGGVLDAIRVEHMSEAEKLELLYISGVSSAEEVTEISGRGVGMDVVREILNRLHGRIQVETEPGRGTSFRLTVPVSLATTLVLIAELGGARVGLPVGAVERLLRLDPDEIQSVRGQPVIEGNGRPLPLFDLAGLLGLSAASLSPEGGALRVAVCGVAERRIALAVRGLYGTQEVVLRDPGSQLAGVATLLGAAILPDGSVLPVADMAGIIAKATPGATQLEVVHEAPSRRRIVLADDSMTTRTLEKSILEAAGYDVVAVGDGRAALEVLRRERFDAVVSDVNMPGLDGLELTAQLRSDPASRQIPVVLVTSLESEEDRARGLEAGADAYIVKRTFDQGELLEVLRRLTGGGS